ncbi:hypothetical protein Cs7R123_21260 [Catellatospora sp. TT07R-123]|nr:hypothetical protein Cs7R123_21260 [Catellatospora sp. TT07R-123]
MLTRTGVAHTRVWGCRSQALRLEWTYGSQSWRPGRGWGLDTVGGLLGGLGGLLNSLLSILLGGGLAPPALPPLPPVPPV